MEWMRYHSFLSPSRHMLKVSKDLGNNFRADVILWKHRFTAAKLERRRAKADRKKEELARILSALHATKRLLHCRRSDFFSNIFFSFSLNNSIQFVGFLGLFFFRFSDR